MKLVIDSREPKSWKEKVSKIASREGFEPTIAPLTYGDYATDQAIVERKSVLDLLSSIYDKRYEHQQEGLCLQADVEDKQLFILIHGSIQEAFEIVNQVNINIDPFMVIGAVSSLVTRTGANVLWITDESEAMLVMVKVLRKIADGKWLQPRKRNPAVLAARLLGVTTWQLNDLLDRFGSLTGIGLASTQALQSIYGIGSRKAERIKSVLNTDLREVK